ncbi:MAG: tetratricopeptide repeat protein [Alphaproteobacteria bacterium]|nr:tetratricopeptide repeat protein [Alphaproteobacteria bacterium]
MFRVNGRLEESRAAGERAAMLGTLPEALVDLADTYVAMGESDLALEFFERAIAKRPNLARAHMGLAQALLMKGEFGPAWAEYEWRYRLAGTENILPKFKQPQWNGMKLKSSRLLIVCEQGYGDCFQFARYLPLVGERVKDVYIGVGVELRDVIQRVKGSHVCYERWEHIPPFDFQITLSSLPLVFGTTLETIPSDGPYLTADAAKAATWRAKLSTLAAGRKTVGFVWQGRPTHPNDRVRSIALGHLTRLLELEGILPVSLQAGAGREQLLQHPARSRVFDAADELATFDDTAALISQLDCVVTIDSAMAHLTGGLGKRGIVMLPKAGEWRWFEKRNDSPWYPSLELVRQDASATWDNVVTRVIDRVRG